MLWVAGHNGPMSDPFDDGPRPQPLWVRVVALIALLGMLAFVVAQVV